MRESDDRPACKRTLAKVVPPPSLGVPLSLAMLTAAFSILAEASPEDAKRANLYQVGMIAFMIVIFYVMLIRPQQKQAKKQAELLKGLKKGDKVVTSSGIIGVVTGIQDNAVTLRSADTKLEVQKSAISQVTGSVED